MRLRTLVWASVAALAAAGAEPCAAQLEINRYPDLWNDRIKQQQEEEKEPEEAPPPSYSGDPVVLPAACEAVPAGLCTAARPCGVELELLGAAKLGERLTVFGDQRTATDTLVSVLLVSEDGGGTWVEAGRPIPGAVLDRAVFPDAEHGFIAGYAEEGGLPLPFLLATSDGGARWEMRPISPGKEERYGSAVDLRFESAEHGYAVIERAAHDGDPFELYETFNGGRSWSIRQLSPDRPRIPGGRRLIQGADWRVDSADGILRVEKLTGAEWSLFARFARDLGQCGGAADETEQSEADRSKPSLGGPSLGGPSLKNQP